MLGVIHDGGTRVPIQQPVLLSGTVAARPFSRGRWRSTGPGPRQRRAISPRHPGRRAEAT
jgi:hypothetical protein